MEIGALTDAFGAMVSVGPLVHLVLGMLLGLLFGIVPGLGGSTALAILLPLTYSLEPLEAIHLAGGVMGANTFGGSLTAILLNTPGSAPNAATTFDGHAMARRGKAGAAIGAAATASALGGLVGLGTLLLVIPVAKAVVLAFGPAEQFLLAALALIAVAAAAREDLLRGLVAGVFGLMAAFVGYDAVSGDIRFTFGIDYLWDGLPLVPLLTGMFAIAPMIAFALEGGSVVRDAGSRAQQVGDVGEGVRATFRHWRTVLRGSAIGTVIGVLPGLGGTVASFIAYRSAAASSSDPASFGKGNVVGVIAPESANNAKDGGALLPTLALGIPGSPETAVFLGILVLHGMDPGPNLLLHRHAEIYGLIAAVTASCIGASALGILCARPLSRVTLIDAKLLAPLVIAVSLTGAFVLRGEMMDMIVALIFGLIGYAMMREGFPRLTFVIAFVLGPEAERSFHMTRMISDGDVLGFMAGRPQSMVLITLCLALLAAPAVAWSRRRRRRRRQV